MASRTESKYEHQSRLNQEQRRQERGKSLIVLMLQHLVQSGYAGAVEALQAESGVSLGQYEVADNIELLSCLQEWEDFYEMRFGRRPKLVRKISAYSSAVDPHGKEAAQRAHAWLAAAYTPQPPPLPAIEQAHRLCPRTWLGLPVLPSALSGLTGRPVDSSILP